MDNSEIKLLLVIVNNNIEEGIISFLNWYKENGKRICVEFPAGLNMLHMADVLTKCKRCLRIINQRTDKYDVLETIVNVKLENEKPLVFPKLSDTELGFQRAPDYLVGDTFEINYINSMIEFIHVTKFADEFNAQEYKKYVEALNESNLSVSSEVIEQLEKKNFNLYDNYSSNWMIKSTDKSYMYGYCSEGYVKYNDKQKKFLTSNYII